MPSRWSALSAASLALAAACAPPRAPAAPPRGASPSQSAADASRRDLTRPPRALVFRAAGFPTVDAPPIDDGVLDAALAGLAAARATSAAELADRLDAADVDVLVLPYGSAFPVDAWPRIRAFLRDGGGLAVLGGAPFHEPVRAEGGAWIREPRQAAFAHDLLLGPAEPIAIGGGLRAADAPGRAAGFGVAVPAGTTTWALTPRLASEREFPDEHGTSGPRDAILRPLAHVVDASSTPRACPLLEIDRLRGPSSGARWVFATTNAALDAKAIRAIVTRAMAGASELRAAPRHASIAPGGRATIDVSVRPGPRDPGPAAMRAEVTDDAGAVVFQGDVALEAAPGSTTRAGSLVVGAALAPGLYRVVLTDTRARPPELEHAAPRAAETGFWVKDARLLASGPKLTVSGDWLRRDGRAFPVVGTTYMASDAHRAFLFEPNPHAWDADFAAMKRRGVNFVRTGLWTAWSRVTPAPGEVDERVLSALEAWVATAAKHGIVVCFNFFAFLPPTYGGTNPYLDPRSIAGQKALVTAFARRFAGVGWVHWDLINEPSYAPPSKLWSTRPIGDAHEAAAWKTWLVKRHGASEGHLRALFREPAGDVYALPRDEDFKQAAVQVDRRSRRARDFRELAEDVVTRWAATMRAAIRDAAGDALVTLGQDEGGIHERATQQLMADALDYTAVHTWWKNDDLLWDGVVTKVPGKPSLHQETGLMRLEDADGAPWRTPEEAARLLERKLGYAFAGRGAGVVEWVWNVNPYMPIDEESTIGIHRPDGTAKPELDALERFARFFEIAARHLDDFEPDPVVLVVPHARAFLGRTGAIDATRAVVRVLAERFGVVPSAISDLRLTPERLRGAKLVVVPGADVLDDAAAAALLEAARAGSKVLVTGAIEGDSYGRRTEALARLGVLGPSRPVAMREKTGWSATGWIAFDGRLAQEWARRAEASSAGRLDEARAEPVRGGGSVWHEPLPLELADGGGEALTRLLGAALAAAKVATSPADGGIAGRVLYAPRAALLTVVNERPEPASRRLVVDGRPIDVAVGARGASLLLVERPGGRTIVSTAPSAR
ncbi:MAG: cellulase family glycosylhydrolase [Labilithrix sp.]|nr:cellulase family glycosylhydrolase [Labilithrix sp.]